ncbi:MAG: hypothetical protein ACPG5O_04125 [Pseudoalteromonas tetraodonis]
MIDPKDLKEYFENLANTYKPLAVGDNKNFYFIDDWEIQTDLKTKLGNRVLILEVPEGEFEGNDGSAYFDNNGGAVLLLEKVKDISNATKRLNALSNTKGYLRDIASALLRDTTTPGHWLYGLLDTTSMGYNKISNQFGGYYGWRMQLVLGEDLDLTVDETKWA